MKKNASQDVIFPNWDDLDPKDRKAIANGFGSKKMNETLVKCLTHMSSWFFNEACWQHHDYGYYIGGTVSDRSRCDWLFFQAMKRDANKLNAPKKQLGLTIGLISYIIVRVYGWSTFRYGGWKTPPDWLCKYENKMMMQKA